MGCCYENKKVAPTFSILDLWQKQRFSRRQYHHLKVRVLRQKKCLYWENSFPLLGKQLSFMLIFIYTLKSPITIVENLDRCVRWPWSFPEAMHLQFLLTISKLSRMASTCNLTCNRLRSRQMSKTYKRIGLDCSTVILMFLISTVFTMFHENTLKNINLNICFFAS